MPGYGILGPTEGTGLLPWAWAAERLEGSHDYWVATVWPDGRPHVTPVWGIWRADAVWFSCSRSARKARNLLADGRCTVSTDDAQNPVIVEGTAALVDDRSDVVAYAAIADAKYEMQAGVDFYGDPANALFRVEPSHAFGIAHDDFTGSPTRWDFT